ncbi:MAG: bifunctional ornithine acetyltransferase/N-acetylglutamate synthase [Candidatus Hydrothermarchaeales archaeon]
MKLTEKGVCCPGFRAGGSREGSYGVALVLSEDKANCSLMVTSNRVKAAPLTVSKEHFENGDIRAIVASSGNANAYTGEVGIRDAQRMCELAATKLGLKPASLLTASTGIIGRRLDMDAIAQGIVAVDLNSTKEASLAAARALMTTDKSPKMVSVKTKLSTGEEVEIGGIAKGAGMIAPDLKHATMLCFVTTNAAIPGDRIDEVFGEAVKQSFNMTVIDGDTSTNDMAILLANGRAGNREIDENFQEALNFVTRELARLMAKDGEGATKFLEIEVRNAGRKEDAVKAAKAIASSNLVKTAFFGEDPNWGRIIAAIGYSGADFDPEEISLHFESENGRINLIDKGKATAGGEIELKKAKDIMKAKEIKVVVDLHSGMETATAYGCDLSPEYVRINAEYST